ncbi:unnamed protein product [Cylicocyclus nassatus]|uniref:receptor protein-tyrosine kinase n=1 Tax=Cylicocyclus nassatus TaxID=53992 RepID=A0AA36DNI2_CYLNA|nr:unnamed protein product [Cylicocyclus nassatus]
MRTLFSILLLVAIAPLISQQFCATDGNDPTPTWAPSDSCTTDSFANIKVPPVLNASAQTYVQRDCGIAVILDLDRTYTSVDDFANVRFFIRDTIAACMSRGIGYRTYVYPMFNSSIQTVCCATDVCSQQIGLMDYWDYVVNYETLAPVQNETQEANFTYSLVGLMKQFAQPKTKCLYNTIVLLTNRIFITNQTVLGKDISNIVNYGCITFTVVALGNTGISQEMMFDYYSTYTQRLFVVPGYNCITNLDDCIRPCGVEGATDCQNEQLTKCPYPTTTTTTTVTTTELLTTTTTTPDPSLSDYWHIIYLFALSNRTTNDEFQRAVKFIATPLQHCAKSNDKVAVRFLAKNNVDSGWLTRLEHVNKFLETLSADEVLLDATETVDVYDNTTLILVNKAVNIKEGQTSTDNEPRITLLTDFVSQNFVAAYDDVNGSLLKQLQPYYFEIIAFNTVAAEMYQNQTAIPRSHIIRDPNYGDSPKNMIELCPNKKPPKDVATATPAYAYSSRCRGFVRKDGTQKRGGTQKESESSVSTIMFVIIGTCAGAVLILIVATILYRQKYMWMEKLNRFRNHHNDDKEVDDDEIIDYWELSPEKVIIKNEQLGHGAYGQVYKGKLIGPSPGIQRYYKTEAARFTDCDCAVKMMPKYASDSTRKEFMHEIELMKTLGCHDNIVCMLGCITAASKTCLVIEFCACRDLLRYLKQRRVELEINRSIDEQIECTKEFLNFAWQIAQGMCYLGQKNIIHRDLAARNILISGTGGMKNAKISDFGLSFLASGDSLPAQGRLPIKWLALECLQREMFSVKSDVWSYGIVLFEMYSMGETPYHDIEPTNLISHLEAGNRPKRPLLASDKVAETMNRCWDKLPEKRPTFEELLVIFATLLEQSAEAYWCLSLLKTRLELLSSVFSKSMEGHGLSPIKAKEPYITLTGLSSSPNLKSTEGYGYLSLIKTAETYIALTELNPSSLLKLRSHKLFYTFLFSVDDSMRYRRSSYHVGVDYDKAGMRTDTFHISPNSLNVPVIEIAAIADGDGTSENSSQTTCDESGTHVRKRLATYLPKIMPFSRIKRMMRRGSEPY